MTQCQGLKTKQHSAVLYLLPTFCQHPCRQHQHLKVCKDLGCKRDLCHMTLRRHCCWQYQRFKASKDFAVREIVFICRRHSADTAADDFKASTLHSSCPRTKEKCSVVNRFVQLRRSTASSRYLHISRLTD